MDVFASQDCIPHQSKWTEWTRWTVHSVYVPSLITYLRLIWVPHQNALTKNIKSASLGTPISVLAWGFCRLRYCVYVTEHISAAGLSDCLRRDPLVCQYVDWRSQERPAFPPSFLPFLVLPAFPRPSCLSSVLPAFPPSFLPFLRPSCLSSVIPAFPPSFLRRQES